MGDQIKRKIDTQQRYTTQFSYARMLRKESIIALSSIQSKRSNYLELCGRLNDKEQDTSMHDLHSLTNTSPSSGPVKILLLLLLLFPWVHVIGLFQP